MTYIAQYVTIGTTEPEYRHLEIREAANFQVAFRMASLQRARDEELISVEPKEGR